MLAVIPAGHRSPATSGSPRGDDNLLDAEFCSADPEADPLGADAIAAGADESWWQAVSAQIARSEYEPKVTAAGLQAPNRAQNLRTTFGARGIEVAPRTSEEVAPTWRFRWQTSGIGREGSMQEVDAVSPEWAGDRVTYRHEGWSEWYVNTAAGLEQGFTLEQRPDGEGPLRIAGNVPAELKPEVREDGAIDFIESHGACAIRYSELHVWDANGIELQSELAVHGSELAIVIDDEDAEYPLMVDPLMTSPAWTAESNQANAGFGISVATAGDVNGDGFSDVIVGAHAFDNGESNEGRAFVYYGSASGLSLNPNWTAESNQAFAQFGWAVATAGDVNDDGFADVIVGANHYSNGEASEGRAFVYHGSASGLSSTANWTAEGNQAGSQFGLKVGTAGDVNGDGFSDVIVGNYLYDNGQTDEGRALVYHGSASGLSLSANWTAESNQVSALFGLAVGTAGDVNGDGFADVIVGAFGFDNGQADEGRAFVYHGSAAGLGLSPAWTAESDQVFAYFGFAVATAGDVNGDGFSDVIVGAYGFTSFEFNEGGAFVYHGSAAGLGLSPAWTADGAQQVGAEFGTSVATAGDVNGDGYSDVIVGSPFCDNGQANEGRSFVYHGSASGLNLTPNWTAESDQADGNFGRLAETAGDVNGDGFSDVIVGAYLFDNGQSDEGRAFVYHGAAAGLAATPGWTAEGDQVSSFFGCAVATAGDVNGDGYSDVIVGATLYDNGQDGEGRAFVYHGSAAGLSTTAVWTVESDVAFAELGTSVATAGDVNGDGYSDVIVGVPYYFNTPQNTQGRVYVYHGSTTGLSITPSWTGLSDRNPANFGHSVATAGDVNGDGYSDIIVGAPSRSTIQTGEGTALVYHGSSTGLSATPSWTRESNVMNANFGRSVSTAGDVNGDGYSDVVVGAPQYGNGRALVYHGSATGLSTTAGWFVESDQGFAAFGFSVASAGDVNADGFSDVIVGADFYDNGQTNEGRAFLYQGSAAGLSTSPAWTAEGNLSAAHFGFAVATAGDVNGDGFSDVIVGAPGYANGQSFEGLAFVYPGSLTGLSTIPSWTAEGNQEEVSFGRAVSAAGDVNGDGYSDVIVGGPGYSNGQSDEGGAFVYYGNGGDGLDRIPRQARSDDTALISLLGRSDSPSAFRFKTLGRTPAGRGNVRLQAEIKPLGVVFNGSGLVFGLETNTGAPSGGGSVVPLSQLVGGLSANTVYHWRLRLVSDSPFFPRSPWFSQVGNAPNEADFRMAGGSVAVADPSGGATHLWLEPSAPNPFKNETRVAYTLPERGHVRLAVYDVVGREVAVLAEGTQDVGRHSQAWDGRSSHGTRLSAGVYFARLEFAGRVEARKMVLAR